eukprot:scaffold205199_cov19-Tisochrysis_lutea.AAC.1
MHGMPGSGSFAAGLAPGQYIHVYTSASDCALDSATNHFVTFLIEPAQCKLQVCRSGKAVRKFEGSSLISAPSRSSLAWWAALMMSNGMHYSLFCKALPWPQSRGPAKST